MANGLIAVIRASGERTADACRALVVRQLGADAVEIVQEQPFEAALRKSYYIGLHRGTEWMLTLDADVFLREGAIAELLAAARALPKEFVQIEGLVHDKLTGIFRKAGHRVYRTRHLGKALEAIPPYGATVRPEFETLRRMSAWGFPSREIDLVVGIHDFEQYYRDIYRKAFVHANKHEEWIADMVRCWRPLAQGDADFRVALRGLYDGLMTDAAAAIDTRRYARLAEAALKDLEIEEKAPMEKGAASPAWVARILNCAGASPSAEKQWERLLRKLWGHRRRVGLFGLIPYLAGAGLCRAGNYLKALPDKTTKSHVQPAP